MVVAAFSQIGGTGKELCAGLARGPGPVKAPQPQDRGHTRLMGGRAGGTSSWLTTCQEDGQSTEAG